MPERDSKGRFLPGNGVAKRTQFNGPLSSDIRHTYFEKFIRKLTVTKWNKLVDKHIDQAIKGDVKSARLIFDYALGKPTQRIVIDEPVDDTPERARNTIMEKLERLQSTIVEGEYRVVRTGNGKTGNGTVGSSSSERDSE